MQKINFLRVKNKQVLFFNSILLLSFLLLASCTFQKDVVIEGFVFRDTLSRNEIFNVGELKLPNVTIKSGNFTTTTDSEGKFTITASIVNPDEEVILYLSASSYSNQTHTIKSFEVSEDDENIYVPTSDLGDEIQIPMYPN